MLNVITGGCQLGKISSNIENYNNLDEEERKRFRPIFFGSAEVITNEPGDVRKKKPRVKKNSS